MTAESPLPEVASLPARFNFAQHLLEGVTADGQLTERARTAVLGELRQEFRPEFLNRVDDIVLFKPLSRKEIKAIIDLLTEQLRQRLADRHIGLKLTEACRDFIAETAYDPVYGARPLKRYLQHALETRIGRALIGGEVGEGSLITVDARNGELLVAISPPAGKGGVSGGET